MLPEELARIKIDKQLNEAGWDIVSRMDYIPNTASAVKEALMVGNKESDYLLFVDNKAIAVVEAKKESDTLGDKVASQAEQYAHTPQKWYGLWCPNLIPLVYLANGNKIYYKNLLKTWSTHWARTLHTRIWFCRRCTHASSYNFLTHFYFIRYYFCFCCG